MRRSIRSRHPLRRRLLRAARIALLAAGAAVALLALVRLQHSALQTIQKSNTAVFQANPTPLLTLTGVELRARGGGKPLLHFTAAALSLTRDMRDVRMSDIRGGADMPASAMHGGAPLRFASDSAGLTLAPTFQRASAQLTLSKASADTRIGETPLHIDAPGLTWQWPHGLARTVGTVSARIGGFGRVECRSISLDVDNRMIHFGPFQAAVKLSALPAVPPSGAPAAGDDQVHFTGKGSSYYSDNNRLLTVDGPILVWRGAVSMRTVGVVYNSKTGLATAQSPVTIVDDRNTLTGTHGTLSFSAHIATLTGDVHMSGYPDGSAKTNMETQASKPTQLKCDHMTYNYRTKLADADGHLVVFQTDRTVTADTGHYDINAQLITLHGDVDGKSADGRHLRAPEAIMSVDPKNEGIQVKGPISYEFPVSDEDNPLPPAAHPNSGASAPVDPPSAASPSAPAPAAPASQSPATPAASSTVPPPALP